MSAYFRSARESDDDQVVYVFGIYAWATNDGWGRDNMAATAIGYVHVVRDWRASGAIVRPVRGCLL